MKSPIHAALLTTIACMACSHSVQTTATQNAPDAAQPSKVQSANSDANETATETVKADKISPKQEEPVNTHDACFHRNQKISAMMVASSIGAFSADNKEFWVAQTPEGEILIFRPQGENFESRTITTNAQIACYETVDSHFRLGWIARNAQDGTYKLEIHDYNAELVENRDEFWLAATRGFMPDAGTKCAFLGRRDLIVVGTRPRGEHVPLHGFFHLQSRSLKLIEGTSEHVPLLESVFMADGKTRLLMRTVERDENNKPRWPYGIYQLIDAEEESQIEKEFAADFIVEDHGAWLAFDKSGCFLKDGTRICPNRAVELREIRALPGLCENAVCVEMLSYQENWIAKIQSDSMELIAIPPRMRFVPAKPRLTGEWLTITMDEARPDLTDGIEFVGIDKECLGI